MKTVITDHPFPNLDVCLKAFAENKVEVEILQTHDSKIILDKAKDAEGLVVGMARIDSKLIDGLNKCKIILRMGVGYDNVDVDAATAKGIMVVNVPDFCTEEVSDHAAALIVMISRRVLHGRQAVRDGKWGPNAIDFTNFKRLNEETVGLYGFGRIARGVAEKVRGVKMNVIACDPFVTAEAMAKVGVQKVEPNELLARADYVSLHTPLTKETEGAFGIEQFRTMKRSAWIINTSRGQVIREEDLIKALDEKLIAGAALDVLAKEPPAKDNTLLTRENVIVTPHMGSWTATSRDYLQIKTAEEVVRAMTGKIPVNVVNKQVLPAEVR